MSSDIDSFFAESTNVEIDATALIHRFLLTPPGERIEAIEALLINHGMEDPKQRNLIHMCLAGKVQTAHTIIALQLKRCQGLQQIALPFARLKEGRPT
jgi:hypothetical protein